MASQLQQVLEALLPRLKRQRPLARACPQLLLDLAALLSGLRPLIMLDHAAGVTPAQLLQALQPLPQLMSQYQGCILHLNGCCYLANIRQLQQHLTSLSHSTSSSSWPAVVTFADRQAALAEPEQCRELQQQLRSLNKALQEQVQDWQLQQQQPPATATPPGAGSVQCATQQRDSAGISRAGCSSSSSWVPVVDLGRVQGLPAMPTLNGFLLGYQAVYWVRDLQEAAAASKVLSMSRLKLHRVHGNCSAVAACDTSSGNSRNSRDAVLMSFTIPEALCDDSFNSKAQQLVARLCDAASSSVRGVAAGCAKSQGLEWTGIEVSVTDIDAQPVSL